MHGRLKVRTSAEEAARKKKEQELKVKAYRAGMAKIHAKRASNELDAEMLTICGQILARNPDVYTLWNIRKECIIKLSENLDQEAKQAIYDKDLGFAEQCLLANPKSYGAWHHRCWILENCPNPNMEREVALCNKYLKLDERNFHTWDYRRFVVNKAGIEPTKELDFCTEKIKNNFSNYSSWHYRSNLLPIIYPHETDSMRPISEEKLKDELEMVLTAAFTDPNDSSAWFYQRWLLGYSRPELDIAAFRINNNQAVIAFTKPITLTDFQIEIIPNPTNSPLIWKSANGSSADSTWFAEHDFSIAEAPNTSIKCILETKECLLELQRCNDGFFALKCPRFEYEFGAAVIDELKNQLESCKQLLELEPDSKWTLLTTALLMRAIDRTKFHEKSIEYLTKLQTIDSMRKGYYEDLASKWSIEKCLENWQSSTIIPQEIDLHNIGLTTIYYDQYFSIADRINLSDNCLTNRSLSKLSSFRFVKDVNLKNNKITTSEGICNSLKYADKESIKLSNNL